MNEPTSPPSSQNRPPENDRCRLCGSVIADRPDAGDGFCCAGCARVFDVLTRLDEEASAKYLKAAQAIGLVPKGPGERKGEVDDFAAFDAGEAKKQERFELRGLVCPSCSWVCEKILENSPGVVAASIDFYTGSALVDYDMRRTSPTKINDELGPFGYQLQKYEDSQKGSTSRKALFRFIAVGVIFVNIMSLATIRYFARYGIIDSAPAYIGALEMIMSAVVIWLGFRPLFARAIIGLIEGRATMELLVGLATAAAFLLSVASLIAGRDDIYFETAAGLVAITLLSRAVEARLREAASAELGKILRLKMRRAIKIDAAGRTDYAAIEDFSAGDRARVERDMIIPFDGILAEGRALIAEAVLTGEPRPIEKTKGDPISAGSKLIDESAVIEVTRRHDETKLFQIAASAAVGLEAAEARAGSADRLAAWFTPAVILISAGAWAWRAIVYGPAYALTADGWFPSAAVLAVACPCAFGLAGASAFTAFAGRLLNFGVLIREPRQAERLAGAREIIFDKTGSLTEGRMTVEKMIELDGYEPGMLSIISAAEKGAVHPAAAAIRAWLDVNAPESEIAENNVEIIEAPGGREAFIGGRKFRVGASALFENTAAPQEAGGSHSLAWFGWDDRAAGVFLIADSMRPEAPGVVDYFKYARRRLSIFSGDRKQVVDWAADTLEIEARGAEMTIEEKTTATGELRKAAGEVVYIGDGANDAEAMAAADVSIAVGGGSDEALGAAGIVMLGGDLKMIPFLFESGKKLRRVIRNNYIWAFSFNGIFIPAAAAGYLTPLLSMLLMFSSSVAVLLNSLRLKKLSP